MTESTESQAPVLSLERVYLRDVSFESPHSPQVFLEQKPSNIGIQISVGHRSVTEEEGYYEVNLHVTAKAELEDRVVFLVELQQAGVFLIKNVPAAEMEKVLEIACPNILLPFAREAVNDLVEKGGFPQLLLNPINFEALYIRKKQAQAGDAPESVN